MSEYLYKATGLIAETFKERDVKFDVVNNGESEQVLAVFPVDCGPSVTVRYISSDNDNDVAVRVYGLISRVPAEKRFAILSASNELNCKLRYVKFIVDKDNDVNVEFDFPMELEDEAVGEVAFEMFLRIMKILDSEYPTYMKALYGGS